MAKPKDLSYYFKGTMYGFRSILSLLLLDLWPTTSDWNIPAAISAGIAVLIFEWLRFPTPWNEKLVPMLIKGLIAGLVVLPATGVSGVIWAVAAIATLSITEKPKGVSFL